MNEIIRIEDFYGYDYEAYPIPEFYKEDNEMKWICADFETAASEINIKENKTYVWLWDIYDKDEKKHINGSSIEMFFDTLFFDYKSTIIYFHNLKFDGSFILDYLLKHGFKIDYNHTKNNGTISTLITDRLVWYTFTVYFNGHKYVFRDSMKKIIGSLARAAESFGLPIRKGEIDYTKHRPEPPAYTPTAEEIDYIHIDTEIMSDILEYYYENGMNGMTNASDAMRVYKEMIGANVYKNLFPVLPKNVDDFIRRSYKGGFCYLNPKCANVDYNEVYTYDIKSMYPSRMHDCKLPWGVPEFYNGEYKYDPDMPLFIQRIYVDCKLKPNHIPSIQTKTFMSIKLNYLIDTEGLSYEMVLTNIDMLHLIEDYEIFSIQFIDGYKFHETNTLFAEYVDHFYSLKESSTGAKKQLYKIFLNSLYGKFAMMTERSQAMPTLTEDEENRLRFDKTQPEEVDAMYTAVASFITSWARHLLLTAINENIENFIYCDTDSMHLTKPIKDSPRIYKVGKQLGNFDLENGYIDEYGNHHTYINHARYLGQKCYMLATVKEGKDGEKKEMTIKKIAGAPDKAKEHIDWDNFRVNLTIDADKYPKMRMKQVNGGIILIPTTFSIKPK